MKVYLVRHCSAVSVPLSGGDSGRYLDADGRQKARAIGSLMADNEVSFDRVISSPYVRAVQTAELMSDRVDFLGTVETHSGLTPDSQPEPVLDLIKESNIGSIAVFGHEPNISYLASLVVGTSGFAPFRTGQVCAFEGSTPLWKIRPDAVQIQDLFV